MSSDPIVSYSSSYLNCSQWCRAFFFCLFFNRHLHLSSRSALMLKIVNYSFGVEGFWCPLPTDFIFLKVWLVHVCSCRCSVQTCLSFHDNFRKRRHYYNIYIYIHTPFCHSDPFYYPPYTLLLNHPLLLCPWAGLLSHIKHVELKIEHFLHTLMPSYLRLAVVCVHAWTSVCAPVIMTNDVSLWSAREDLGLRDHRD